MLKIITIFALAILSLTLHAHNRNDHTSIQQRHFGNDVPALNSQDESAKIKSLIENVSQALTQKDASKYQPLITDTQQIQTGLNNLQQALGKYNLPVTPSSKLCPGVTTFNRTQIRIHIRQIQQKQANAVQYLSTCLDCGFVSTQILQIQNRTNQLNLNINKTLDGSYCNSKKVDGQKATGLVNLKNSYFKTNLKGKNWYYGSTTASDYKIYAFKRSSTFNLTNCPLDTPFVNDQEQVCFKCPQQSIFNLGTQKCDTCKPNQILNVKSGKCDECVGQKILTNGEYVCKLCNLSQGYLLNETTFKCNKCGKNTYLDAQKKTCVSISCDINTPRFNLTTKACQACGQSQIVDPNDVTHCIQTNYVGICPPATPKYDLNSKQCIGCPAGTTYYSQKNECVKSSSSHFKVQHKQ